MGQHSEIHISEQEATIQEDEWQAAWQHSEEVKEETITALELFEKGLTKKDLSQMATSAVESVLEQGNPLQVAEALSAMECFIKEVRADKRFTDYVREEAGKTPKGYIAPSGAKIELAEVGTKYDFSLCNDPILSNLESDLSQIEKEIDDRKKFLKTLPLSGIEFMHGGEELFTIYPPSKTSTSSFKITLAK